MVMLRKFLKKGAGWGVVDALLPESVQAPEQTPPEDNVNWEKYPNRVKTAPAKKKRPPPAKKRKFKPSPNLPKSNVKLTTHRGTGKPQEPIIPLQKSTTPIDVDGTLRKKPPPKKKTPGVRSVLNNPWAYAVGGSLATLALHSILTNDDDDKTMNKDVAGPPQSPGRFFTRY